MGTQIQIADALSARKSQAASNRLNGTANAAQPPMSWKPMHTYPLNVLNVRSRRARKMPGPKSCRTECIGCDHVNLVAASRKLLGKVLNQHRGPIDRGEVGLCDQH